MKLIFIAGASRSGSTMPAEQIAAATGGVNCGELRRIREFYAEDWNHVAEPASRVECSCGRLDLARTSFSGQVGWAQGALSFGWSARVMNRLLGYD